MEAGLEGLCIREIVTKWYYCLRCHGDLHYVLSSRMYVLSAKRPVTVYCTYYTFCGSGVVC